MPIIYNGREVIPAPLVSVNKEYIFDNQGNVLSPRYTFTLTGTVVPNDDASIETRISDSNAFGGLGMDTVNEMQEQLRDIFGVQNGRLEINPPDGLPNVIHAYCKVQSVDIREGVWVQRADYVITLTSNEILDEEGPTDLLQSKSENWNIEEQTTGVYAITHTLSAVGLSDVAGISGNVDTLLVARDWCHKNSYVISSSGSIARVSGTIGFGLSNVLSNLSSYTDNFWNYSVAENIGTFQNSWQLTETFIHYSGGQTREEWTLSTQENIETNDRSIISINGSVLGNANRDRDLAERFNAASGSWELSVRPQLFSRANAHRPSGTVVNPEAASTQVTYDRLAGAIRYAYNFNANRSNIITGAVQEEILVVDNGTTDVFAQIQIPGRTSGPLVQNMETTTLPTRSLTVNAIFGPPADGPVLLSSLKSLYESKPNISGIINALIPSAGFYYVTQDQENWNPIQRRYSRSLTWTLDPNGNAVSGIPNAQRNPE